MLDYYIDCKTGKKGDLDPAQFAVCKNGHNDIFSGDIMNGATLLQSYFDIIINKKEFFCDFKQEWNQCKKATKKDGKFDKLYNFLYESKTVKEEDIEELFGESLYKYVRAVSQLGNFMPCPVGYNYHPGPGAFNDRMDIKLKKYDEKNFSSDTDNPFKKIFKEWEIFVEANFLEMYFEDNDYKKIKPLFVRSSEPRTPITSSKNCSNCDCCDCECDCCDWNKYFNKTSELINKRTKIIMQEIFKPHTSQPSV